MDEVSKDSQAAAADKNGAEEMEKRAALPKPEREVSALTISRMMGLATVTEVKLLEGKLDLIQTKLTNLSTRLEKALTILANTPTGGDLERIDIQLANIRNLLTEALTKGGVDGASSPKAAGSPVAPSDAPRPRARIISSRTDDAE